jgi:hypothetical protein
MRLAAYDDVSPWPVRLQRHVRQPRGRRRELRLLWPHVCFRACVLLWQLPTRMCHRSDAVWLNMRGSIERSPELRRLRKRMSWRGDVPASGDVATS